VGEGGIAAAARRVRLELRRGAPGIDRAADRGIALRVRRIDALLPVRIQVGVRWKMGARRRCVARCNLDLDLRSEVAELREPEALLVDEIEREAITAGWNRAA
jgi:hypothetical protein